MCKTKNFFDHTGLFHKGLNRALTEHELDATLIPDDWHKAFTNDIHLFTGKWLVGPMVEGLGMVTAILRGLPKKRLLPATREWSALLGIGRLDKSKRRSYVNLLKM